MLFFVCGSWTSVLLLRLDKTIVFSEEILVQNYLCLELKCLGGALLDIDPPPHSLQVNSRLSSTNHQSFM